MCFEAIRFTFKHHLWFAGRIGMEPYVSDSKQPLLPFVTRDFPGKQFKCFRGKLCPVNQVPVLYQQCLSEAGVNDRRKSRRLGRKPYDLWWSNTYPNDGLIGRQGYML
jgi:hypothetical protein